MPSKGRRETLGCNPTRETERDLTHVKQGDALANLISVSPVSNATRAQAVHEMAISVHNLAVEEAAALILRRHAQWSALAGDENNDRRLARTMMSETAELAQQIRKLLRAP